MPLFRRRPHVDPAEVNWLRHELVRLRADLDATRAEQREQAASNGHVPPAPPVPVPGLEISDPVDEIATEVPTSAETATVLHQETGAPEPVEAAPSLDHALVPPPPPAPAPLVPPEPGVSLAELRAQIQELSDELSEHSTDSERARELAVSVGTRLDGLASELGHQIDELAGEIEALQQRATFVSSLDPEVIESLRSGQIRLANEQARYEIAFRQDLAALADELRRPRP